MKWRIILYRYDNNIIVIRLDFTTQREWTKRLNDVIVFFFFIYYLTSPIFGDFSPLLEFFPL